MTSDLIDGVEFSHCIYWNLTHYLFWSALVPSFRLASSKANITILTQSPFLDFVHRLNF